VGTLFRGMGHTALFSCWARSIARKYLTKPLQALVRNVCQLYEEGKSLEVREQSSSAEKARQPANPNHRIQVDPARLAEGAALTENVAHLALTTRSFLENIVFTVDKCPAYSFSRVFSPQKPF